MDYDELSIVHLSRMVKWHMQNMKKKEAATYQNRRKLILSESSTVSKYCMYYIL